MTNQKQCTNMNRIHIFLIFFLVLHNNAISQHEVDCDSIQELWIKQCCVGLNDTVVMINGVGGKRILLKREYFIEAEQIESNIKGLEVISYTFSYPDPSGMNEIFVTSNSIDYTLKSVVAQGCKTIWFINVWYINELGVKSKTKDTCKIIFID